MRVSKLLNISLLADEFQTEPSRSQSYELGVGVAADSPKQVIEMSCREHPAMLARQPAEHMEQHHRIDSSRNRDENDLVGLKEILRLDSLLNFGNQMAHSRMLILCGTEASCSLISDHQVALIPSPAMC